MKVYIHYRKDNKLPFYVGITSNNIRPYTKEGRNSSWIEIANSVGFYVEILGNDFDAIQPIKKTKL